MWREKAEIKVTKEVEDQMWIGMSYKGHTQTHTHTHTHIHTNIYHSTHLRIDKQNEKTSCNLTLQYKPLAILSYTLLDTFLVYLKHLPHDI